MAVKMKAGLMTKPREIQFIERPVPTPKDHEALVKLEYVGICGSDVHYYETGTCGSFVADKPFILGHESAGTVIEVGKDVTNVKPGDRVALEPGTTCGKCEFCKKGLYNLCKDVQFFAAFPVDGVFQEYVAHEATMCFKLPDNMSTLEGALIEPLSVGFHAANQGGAHAGQTCVVTGSGCIGLVSMMALKAMGVSKVISVDVLDKRLDKALELGADAVINGKKEDTIARVMELTEGKGADLVIDTSGTDLCLGQAIKFTKKGATIVMVGYSATGQVTLPMSIALDKELTFKSVFRYRNIYPMAIDAVAAGRVNLKDLCTNLFDFDELPKAMELSVTDKANIVKAAIKMPQ